MSRPSHPIPCHCSQNHGAHPRARARSDKSGSINWPSGSIGKNLQWAPQKFWLAEVGKTLTFEAMLLPSLLPVAAPSQVRQIRWISIAHQVRRGPTPLCRGRVITITCDGWIPKHSSSLHQSSSFTISKFEFWKVKVGAFKSDWRIFQFVKWWRRRWQ